MRIIPWVVRKRREECKELLKIVVSQAKKGHWLELQQAELWANRLGIPFVELYDGPMSPMPSKDGYEHLGYIIAESMSLRDNLRRGQIDEADFNPRQMIKALISAGALPELWKLVLAILRKRGWNATNSDERRAALRAWWRTEYTLPMRLFVAFFP
jgi:hypothetical protein